MTWTNLVPWDLTILQGISSLPKANSHGSKCSLRVHIGNLRYADDNTLMAESVEELKSLLMGVKKLA